MKKILIIEDHRLLCDEIRDWFTYEGFQTFAAYNGREGVELALKYLPDIILCDIMMPELSGKQILNALRNHPATKLIPFIFMTALAERHDIRTGMALGADDYITKPFTRQEVLTSVNSRLKKTEEIRENAESVMQELRDNIIHGLPHELRTPLNAMVAYGEMLKDFSETFSPQEIKEMGEQIFDSAMRLFRLIENYLLYAQLELKAGAKEQYVLLHPAVLCQKTAQAVAVRHRRENDLQLLMEDAPVKITELEFAKIVEELVDNAFKFSKPNQAVVLSCGRAAGSFRLTVQDHGRGMAAVDIQRIGAYMQFDRKQQAQEGSGFGLIISKRIVELFDGQFNLESTPGQGSLIRITLPAPPEE